MNEMDNIVKLIDEEGNEVSFEVLDVIDYKEERYAILVPDEDDGEADSVVILRVDVDADGEETLSSVEDDETLEAVFEIFKENCSDEFDFVD